VRQSDSAGNWVSPEDIANLLALSGFEQVRLERKVLLPLPLPGLSWLCNRLLAPLPLINALCLVNIVVARARKPSGDAPPSVSVVVPARNEAGNLQAILDRLPAMGPQDEVIFIEGHSTDGTWQALERLVRDHQGRLPVRIARQNGYGKGDAVRTGFAMANNDILMILDADLTVPPEELPRFYRIIAEGRGEFINGSRLVYPMEANAMQFANLVANKGFALIFSFLLGQRFKDTLCGTKVIRREHYRQIAANRGHFGDFDPFGDFDLLFGAAHLGLKIIEVPIHYRQRTYGTTNIQRWRHGLLLARMVVFAARKLTFI
jgi:glycosyltransferase involved in cell wall biosynthesis